MCYVYIHTCNHNESLINKIKSKSDHFEKDAERDRSRQRDMSNLKTYPIILLITVIFFSVKHFYFDLLYFLLDPFEQYNFLSLEYFYYNNSLFLTSLLQLYSNFSKLL